jgi:hypothetical protein
MKKPLKRLSQYVGISANVFLKRGLFNPSVDGDTDLFIDPRLLSKSKFKIFKEDAINEYNRYYEELAKKIKFILKIKDKKTREKMKENLAEDLSAPDLEGLMLGYAGHNPGRGATGSYTKAILNNAFEIYENYDGDSTIFSLLNLLTEGIGADYIGDITSQIIRKQIYKFTENISKTMKISTELFIIEGEKYQLPLHPDPPVKKRIPILIVPNDILSQLPTDANFDYVFGGFLNDNDKIRSNVNKKIATIFSTYEDKVNRQKHIFQLVKEDKDLNDVLLEYVSKIESDSYNFNKDNKGIYDSEKLRELLNFNKLEKLKKDSTENIVDKVVKEFQKYISNDNDLKRLLLWKNENKCQPESHWQKIFQLFSYLYLEYNNIDLSPETSTNKGFVDFKLSRGSNERILIEMKLSKNLKFKNGLTKQLEEYKTCFNNVKKSYYIYIDLEKDFSISNQKRTELMRLKKELDLNTEIIFINGLIQKSASKL